MRQTLDIPTEGLPHDHTHLELSVEHSKRRGNYFYFQPVQLADGFRSMILMGEDGSVRHMIDNQGRLNTKKLAAMRELIFAFVDHNKLVECFKSGDKMGIINEVLGALETAEAA